MKPSLLFTLAVVLMLSGCTSSGASLVTASNGTITVTSNLSQFAGSISSIVFNGRQFVNAFDHGRLFQTAMQVDGYGECNNPTEAGGADGKASKLLAHNASADTIATEVAAAYWSQKPNGLNFCPLGADPRVNGPISNTVISKRVEVGKLLDNVVTWHVGISSPDAQVSTGIEVLTGYLPASFTRAFWITPNGGMEESKQWKSVTSATDGYPDGGTFIPTDTMVSQPIIFATEDLQHAIGVLRPAGTIKPCEAAAYHLFRFDLGDDKSDNAASCMKFSVVSHSGNGCNNPRADFIVHLAFGNAETVRKTVWELML